MGGRTVNTKMLVEIPFSLGKSADPGGVTIKSDSK
jgi:hypothetical protein